MPMEFTTTAGVAQGSIILPLFYNIDILDIQVAESQGI